MFAVVLAFAFAALNSDAVMMNSIQTFSGLTCAGTPLQNGLPISLANQCIPISTYSYKAGCDGTYNVWQNTACSGSAMATVSIANACYPDAINQISYKTTCQDYTDVVKVNFHYGACNSTALQGSYQTYVRLNTCTPVATSSAAVSLGGFSANTNFQRSYMVTQSGSTYTINYYYNTDCTGSPVVYAGVAPRTCATAGTTSGSSGASDIQSAQVEPVATSSPNGDMRSCMVGTAGVASAIAAAVVML